MEFVFQFMNHPQLSLTIPEEQQHCLQYLQNLFVEEFEDIKREIHPDVSVRGLANTSQGNLVTEGEANIYFYPTGEKDGAIVFFNTTEEFAFIEVQAFMADTNVTYEVFKTDRVAKLDDIVQTRVDEVYKEWKNK